MMIMFCCCNDSLRFLFADKCVYAFLAVTWEEVSGQEESHVQWQLAIEGKKWFTEESKADDGQQWSTAIIFGRNLIRNSDRASVEIGYSGRSSVWLRATSFAAAVKWSKVNLLLLLLATTDRWPPWPGGQWRTDSWRRPLSNGFASWPASGAVNSICQWHFCTV